MTTNTILVIDDSRMIRIRVKQMLPEENVEILEARDGKEGVDLIRSQTPRLIILDFLLPKMSGWEVFQEIQKEPQSQTTPLVLMSGRKEEVAEKIPEPFENFAFVEKPFEKEQLVEAIQEAENKASSRPPITSAPQKQAEADSVEVSTLAAELGALTEKVENMQAEIDTLNKRMGQVVGFIRKLRENPPR